MRNIFFNALMILFFLSVGSPAQTYAASPLKGAYLETGVAAFIPFAGEKLAMADRSFGFTSQEVNPGGGMQISAGYGFGFISIGGKVYYAYLPSDPAGSPNSALVAEGLLTNLEVDVFGMDVEARIFPAANSTGAIQPYILTGLGWGVFNPDFKQGDVTFSTPIGLGLQFLLSEHIYLAVEGSYRPIFQADPCGLHSREFDTSVYTCDGGETLHLVQTGVNVGFRF